MLEGGIHVASKARRFTNRLCGLKCAQSSGAEGSSKTAELS